MKKWILVLLCGMILCTPLSVTQALISCGFVCGDLTDDGVIGKQDYIAMAKIGGTILRADQSCISVLFDSSGTGSIINKLAWDLFISDETLLNLCQIPEITPFMQLGGGISANMNGSGGPVSGGTLLVTGKKTISGCSSTDDQIYMLDSQMNFVTHSYCPVATNVNWRLTGDAAGNVYQLHGKFGLTRLNDGVSVVTPGGFSITSDPRYQGNAHAFLGLHRNETEYGGRPILDAAIDSQGYVYVVPVVVKTLANPDNTYMAAAKLQLNSGTPCYSIVRLYDDAPDPNDDQDTLRKGLCEIEVDNSGNVYILNCHIENSSDFLLAYPANGGAPTRVNMDTYSGVQGGIVSPTAMCASKKSSLLYLASTINDPEASSTKVYALSTQNFSFSLARTLQINGMGHVTGITENPVTGDIWVSGYRMQNIPQTNDPNQPSFSHPYLVKIPATSDNPVTATALTSTDLDVPLSIMWLPAQITQTKPVNEKTLWRNQKNIIRLTFNSDITAPGAGAVVIQEMLANGQYGSDLSSGFTFTVENNSSGKPRILKIRETGSSLTNQKWYAVRNTGSWAGVATFKVQYMTQWLDSTNDGYVTTDDVNYSFSGVPCNNCADDDRRDFNGDGMIYMLADCYEPQIYIGNEPVAKPSGH